MTRVGEQAEEEDEEEEEEEEEEEDIETIALAKCITIILCTYKHGAYYRLYGPRLRVVELYLCVSRIFGHRALLGQMNNLDWEDTWYHWARGLGLG